MTDNTKRQHSTPEASTVGLPPRAWGQFRFRAKTEAVPGVFFTGPLWYGHVCGALGLDRPGCPPLADVGVAVAPLDRGVGAWQSGETADVLVQTWGALGLEGIREALSTFQQRDPAAFTALFDFEGLHRSGACGADDVAQLGRTAENLASHPQFTVVFNTPARIKSGYVRRAHGTRRGAVKKARDYVDERNFSLAAVLRACWARLCALRGGAFIEPDSDAFAGVAHQLFPGEGLTPVPIPEGIDNLVTDTNLLWMRVPYSKSRRDMKDIGGLIGEVSIARGLPDFWCRVLLTAGPWHVGGYTSFGLGQLGVPGAESAMPGITGNSATSLLERIVSPERLERAAVTLHGTAADIDGATPADLGYARPDWYSTLRREVLKGTAPEKPLKVFRIPKKDGSSACRTICIASLADRVLQRSAHEVLQPAVDAFLSDASFAYRKGFNREGALQAVRKFRREGFRKAIRADIEAFFDSVQWNILARRLRLLYGSDPIVDRMLRWVQAPVAADSRVISRTQGLPQGMALSPLLANLLLDHFDRSIAGQDLRLVRYGDDFVLLLKEDADPEQTLARVTSILAEMGLSLHPDKTRVFDAEEAFDFLGYRVEAGESDISIAPAELDGHEGGVFQELSAGAHTVYLAGDVRGAGCKHDDLVLYDRERRVVAAVSWKTIGRIVAVGYVATTGAVQRTAMQRGVPVLYLNQWGRLLGEAIPAHRVMPALFKAQHDLQQDTAKTLDFVREGVTARLHNLRVVLRRLEINEPRLKALQEKAAKAATVDSARGFEGAGARIYWEHFATLVAPFSFPGRHYHPPHDPVNAMLSLLYTLLYHRFAVLLRAHGLDPALGFYHQSHGAHAALASDMMEDFRHLVEQTVLRLIRQNTVTPADFPEGIEPVEGAFYLPAPVFRKVVLAFETRLQKSFTSRRGKRLTVFESLDDQVRDLRASLLLQQTRTPLRID